MGAISPEMDFSTVTEVAGDKASIAQLDRMFGRYYFAAQSRRVGRRSRLTTPQILPWQDQRRGESCQSSMASRSRRYAEPMALLLSGIQWTCASRFGDGTTLRAVPNFVDRPRRVVGEREKSPGVDAKGDRVHGPGALLEGSAGAELAEKVFGRSWKAVRTHA
jgi:hypothetical protein